MPTDLVLDPTTEQFRIDPYPLYAELRDNDPIHHNAERGFWAISRFADVQSALRDWETFSSVGGVELDASLFGQGDFIVMDPPDHDALRRLVSPKFQAKAMTELVPLIERVTQESLDALRSDEPFDAITAFAQRVPAVTICSILGLPQESAGWAVAEVNAMMTRHGATARSPEVLDARDRLEATFLSAVTERIHSRAWVTGAPSAQHDIMTDLASAVDSGQLSMEDVPGLCLTLIAAGTETTAGLISGVLHGLATGLMRPEQITGADGRVRLEALDEFLRYDAPIQWLGRTTTCPVTLHGCSIPAGSKVLLLYGSGEPGPTAVHQPGHLELCCSPSPQSDLR